MSQSITTSIRLPANIRKQLEKVSRLQNEGKNNVIVTALKSYFEKLNRERLSKDARSQSLLASKKDGDDTSLWEKNLDLDDWKA